MNSPVLTNPPIKINDMVYREAGLDYAISPHYHTATQWYCVLYGAVDTTINGTTYPLRDGESILIPPRAIRAPQCGGRAPGYFHVVFDNHRLQLAPLVLRPLAMPPELQPDLYALIDEFRHPGPNTRDLVQTLVVRLLIGLNRQALRDSSEQDAPSRLNEAAHRAVIARIEAYMQHNLHHKLRHEQLAEVVNLSPTHLARLFKQITGKTILTRLTELRIDSAKTLLLESSLLITEISGQVGYESLAHFTRTFKTVVGVTPSDYRRSGGHTWRQPS